MLRCAAHLLSRAVLCDAVLWLQLVNSAAQNLDLAKMDAVVSEVRVSLLWLGCAAHYVRMP